MVFFPIFLQLCRISAQFFEPHGRRGGAHSSRALCSACWLALWLVITMNEDTHDSTTALHMTAQGKAAIVAQIAALQAQLAAQQAPPAPATSSSPGRRPSQAALALGVPVVPDPRLEQGLLRGVASYSDRPGHLSSMGATLGVAVSAALGGSTPTGRSTACLRGATIGGGALDRAPLGAATIVHGDAKERDRVASSCRREIPPVHGSPGLVVAPQAVSPTPSSTADGTQSSDRSQTILELRGTRAGWRYCLLYLPC